MKMKDVHRVFHWNVEYNDTQLTSDNWISCQAVTASLWVGGHQASGPADCTRIGLTGSGSTFDWRYLVRSIERERSDLWLFCLLSSSGSCLMESWGVGDLQINSLHFRSKPVHFGKRARKTQQTTKIPVITYLKESRGDSKRRASVGEQFSTPDGSGSMSWLAEYGFWNLVEILIFIGYCGVLSRPKSRDAETRNERNSPRARLAWRPNVDATLHICSSLSNLPKFHTKLEMLKLLY